MSTYLIAAVAIVAPANGHLLKIGFNPQVPGQNDQIVRDAVAALATIEKGGELVLLNGPASLPVAIAIGHGVAHLYGGVACYDPKLNSYVVAISHDPRWAVGNLIPAAEMKEA